MCRRRRATWRPRGGGEQAVWRLARRLEQRAPGARRGEARRGRAGSRVLVFGNLSMVTSTNGNGGVVDVSSKGLVTECRPIPGVVGFSFSGLFSHLV